MRKTYFVPFSYIETWNIVNYNLESVMDDYVEAAGGCRLPPELDDLVLIAAIDGEADGETMAHLRVCTHCAERAKHFADLQGLLRQQLFRLFCPTSETLVAFHQGGLESDQRASMAAHLNDCPYCGRELELIKHLTAEGLPGRSPPEVRGWHNGAAVQPERRPRRLTATPLPQARYALAGAYRGPAQMLQYAYQAENLQITIGVRRLGQRADRRVVVGMLETDADLPSALGGATASLLQCDRPVSTVPLDELGNFVLDDIAAGTYCLALRVAGCEVIIDALSL